MPREIKDPNYSRPFDVHVWSEHSQVNAVVNTVFRMLPRDTVEDLSSKSNRKGTPLKHLLKVLLIDLFVTWKEDPDLCLGLSMANGAYRPTSRYNELHISKKIRSLAHALNDLELLDWANHSHNSDNSTGNRTTRIRASENLQELFQTHCLEEDFIRLHDDIEVLILRDVDENDPRQVGKKKKSIEVEYNDSQLPEYLKTARADLKAYNALLNRSHVDVGNLDEPVFKLKNDQGREVNFHLHQGRHCVRRIFARESFDLNGRFYGGWWQLCPKKHRPHIKLNGEPTVEVDFSGIHPRILAHQIGIELGDDPYELTQLVSDQFDRLTQRKLVKQFVLIAINAANQNQAYQALRHKFSEGFNISLTKKVFEDILSGFVQAHPRLEPFLFSDQGIRLMNTDSRIAAEIINDFVQLEKPILTVHDSFIVRVADLELLEAAMTRASQKVLGAALNFERDKEILGFADLPKKSSEDYQAKFEKFKDIFGSKDAFLERFNEWKQKNISIGPSNDR